jgi:hypothetical protein
MPANKQSADNYREAISSKPNMLNLDTNFLLASLLWGTIGSGYFLYGKKQTSAVCMIGGLALIVISCFIGSAFLLSLVSIVLIVGMHHLMRLGY